MATDRTLAVNQTTPPVFRSTAQAQQAIADIERALESDIALATALARDALAGGLEHPRVLTLVAYQYEQEGRYPDAMRLLDRAAGLDPTDASVWNSVGLCLVKQGKRRGAVSAFEHALGLDPLFAQVYYNLGTALEDLGDYEGAREQFERGAGLFPDYAGPIAGIATLAVRNGDWTTAREYARRALELQPSQTAAISAMASADINEKNFEAARHRLSRLLADPILDRFDRPSVECLLGDALDGLDRPDEAFAAYLAGKTGFRDIHRDQYEKPGEETQLGFVRRLITYFDSAPPEAWAAPPPRTEGENWPATGHAFLVGFPRSGTTLLENVLATHPDVLAIDERGTLKEFETLYTEGSAALDRLAALPITEAAQRRAEYWTGIREQKLKPDGKVVVDKMPLYTTKLPIISKLFPGVKILFALRDPRDVVLSCFRRAFQINSGMYQFVTLEGSARYYDAVMTLADLYRRKLPLDLHIVRYESLVADFEGETRAACEFLGIDWRDGLRDFAENARQRQIRTPSAAQIRGGLYTSGAGQWRRYEKHLQPIMPILAPWIERFGYDLD